MMILQVMVRTPEHPNALNPVENPLYGYQFELDRARWDSDVGFSWEDMFRDVVSQSMQGARANTHKATSFSSMHQA